MALLEISDLKTYFFTDEGVLPSVDGVSFSIERGETLGIVGESGCGKSVTAMTVMRLTEHDGARIDGGRVRMRMKSGQVRDLATLSDTQVEDLRGSEISIVFQDPMSSLNPVFRVGGACG